MIALPNKMNTWQRRWITYQPRLLYSIFVTKQAILFKTTLPKQDLCKISYQKYYISNVQSRIKIYCHILFLWALINSSIS